MGSDETTTSSRADDQTTRQVFAQVSRCMDNLVGGSGHLGAYHLDRASFVITGAGQVEPGLTEYRFRVDGWVVSEFSAEAPSDPLDQELLPESEPAAVDDPLMAPPLDPGSGGEPEHLEGSIVLDAAFEIVLDGKGRVRLRPWRTVDPDLWLR